MNDQERAQSFLAWLNAPGHDPVDCWATLSAQFAAARADERQRMRGSEVLPLVRHLAEVGHCAAAVRRERKWAYWVNRIDLIVGGCRLAWPDLFDEADRLEHGGGS